MATFDELKQMLVDNAAAAEDANVQLDAINVKIDELRALVATGAGITDAQLAELSTIATTTKTSLEGVATDIADAQQS